MVLVGKSVVPGAAIGKIIIHSENINSPKEIKIRPEEVQAHLDKYESVKEKALSYLDNLISGLKDDPKAKFFEAHKEIVIDIVINEEIPAKIQNDNWSGDWAVFQVYETVINVLKNTEDALISDRASDFEDVRTLLLRLWNEKEGTKGADGTKGTEGILAVHELLPSSAASLDKEKVLAILTETGGVTSHAAIIAKSLGIPTIMGISNLFVYLRDGQIAAVDADTGKIILNPDNNTAKEYQKKADAFHANKKEDLAYLSSECFTKCRARIDIGLNIANANKDLENEKYADSVGVFRTEFLFMDRSALPSCEEQFEIYKKVLECFKEKPVIIRTLDIGGDKQAPCLKLPKEDNPFLGVRALRFCFTNPDIFKTQIKALLRASVYGNLWIMLPMAGSIEDIKKAKEHIAEASEELKKEGVPLSDYKTGIMIEIPSIALLADLAAKEVDFASIGSNDLCQYLCAADRMNPHVEEYYQSYHPGMLRLFKEVIAAFDKEGKPVSICGELGADPKAVPLLIGLGLRKFSMNAGSLARVKRVIASVTVKDCEELAQKALVCSTSDQIKALLTRNTN